MTEGSSNSDLDLKVIKNIFLNFLIKGFHLQIVQKERFH